MTAAVNGQKIFAAGRFFGIANVTNPTPTRFSIPQDMSITFKRSVKSLFGENQLPADVSAGTMEVTGKVSMGTLNPRIFADLLFGDAGTAGQILEANNEAGTIPGSVAYTVTVSNSATWTTDLGVYNYDTGVRMTRVASAPTTGQYSVAAGVYTFSSTDANANVRISYLYTQATGGEKITLTNQQMGSVGAFTGVMQFNWASEQSVLTLNKCLSSDVEITTKLDDYAKPPFGFMAACDANDNLGTFSFAEAA